MHGRKGEGRLAVAAIGPTASWSSVSRVGDQLVECLVERKSPSEYRIHGDLRPTRQHTGTVVEVGDFHRHYPELEPERMVSYLLEEFALYLSMYPGRIDITYSDELLRYDELVDQRSEKELFIELEDGTARKFALTIIEWKNDQTERSLSLCDTDGFTLQKTHMQRVKAPRFNFTAYLRGDRLRELNEQNMLVDLSPEYRAIYEAAIGAIQEHFKERVAEDERRLVERWRAEEIYPYGAAPASPLEHVEREVFVRCARTVEQKLETFQGDDKKGKRFIFELLRTAIDRSPGDLFKVFTEVLDLPKKDLQDLSKMLDRTSLSAIIQASAMVAERLEFIVGLEDLLNDPGTKNSFKEREQLHRMVQKELWLFGDKWLLSVSDSGLTKALVQHAGLLGQKKPKGKVQTSSGRPERVDLMLSAVTSDGADHVDHLVVELKRPNVMLDQMELAQLETYANTVADDSRFHGRGITWNFWFMTVQNDRAIERRKHQTGLPKGCVTNSETVRVWVKTWAELLQDCKNRLHFVQEKLNYYPDLEAGLNYMREKYAAETTGVL